MFERNCGLTLAICGALMVVGGFWMIAMPAPADSPFAEVGGQVAGLGMIFGPIALCTGILAFWIFRRAGRAE